MSGFRRISAIILIAAPFLLSCASMVHTDPKVSNIPRLYDNARSLKKLAVIVPYVYVAEVSAGGISEERDEWETIARKTLNNSIIDSFKQKGIELVFIEINNKNIENLREISAISFTVAESVGIHTVQRSFDDNYFPELVTNFDYSIGPVKDLLKEYSADGLLVVTARCKVLSAGRQLMRLRYIISPGFTHMTALIANPEGQVLWVNNRWWQDADIKETGTENSMSLFTQDVRDVPWAK